MKTLITFLFSVSVLVTNAQDFAPQGATWHYSESFFYPLPYVSYFMKFEVTGDTIIDGQNCSIIHKEGKALCYQRPDNEFVYSSNDTVFVYDQNDSIFRVLYDFSANAGDSWEYIVDGFDPSTDQDTNVIMVDSTDTIIFNGQSLKRQFVTYQFSSESGSYEYPSTIIERMGDTKYMFNYYQDLLFTCDMNWSAGLRCYEDSLIGLYETGIADSCEYFELYNSVSEHEFSSFSLSPNPAHDQLKINVHKGVIEMIRILDNQGRLILETKEGSIDISQFESGIYLVSVQSENRWSQQRFIKK